MKTNLHTTPLRNLLRKEGLSLSTTRQLLPDIQSLVDSFEALYAAQQQALTKGPRRFTFNNQTYIHIPGTETFTVPNSPVDENDEPLETYTALQIMKATFPDTRTWRRRITPTNSAEPMLWLGDSARFKIIRAVQLHNATPPVTDETNQYTPFFQFLSEGVEDHWTVQQQYSSCKWAAPKDEALATSMMLHFGWAPKYQQKMKGNCIYQMRRAADGIHLILSEPHTYNDRLFASCARALTLSQAFAAKNKNAPYDLLFKEACRVFFSFNGYYISITSDYRQAALNKIQAYCLHLTNALATEPPQIPFLEEPDPDTCIEVEYDKDYDQPVEYVMLWEDFLLEDGATTKQQEHLERVHDAQALDPFITRTAELDLNGEYTNEELHQYCSYTNLSTAKKKGYLIKGRKEGRKQYWKLNYERS